MVREYLREITTRGDGGGSSAVVLLIWAALVSLSVISAIVFSCAGGGGASKDKDSGTHADTYGGSTCVAGCGAACGG
ncbi:hypothetical protein AB3S75_008988 [Citrus x aurantiifolia]